MENVECCGLEVSAEPDVLGAESFVMEVFIGVSGVEVFLTVFSEADEPLELNCNDSTPSVANSEVVLPWVLSVADPSAPSRV